MAFTDLAVLQSELELKRRRELHRQNSQKLQRDNKQGQKNSGEGQENNFNSLPWEEIIPRRVGGVPVMPPEHELKRSSATNSANSRSKSQDTRKKESKGIFSGSGWFNPGHVWREAEPDVRGLGGNGNIKQQGHWLLKERDTPLLSMPPNMDTLRDSGIGLASSTEPPEANSILSRNEPKRSSFGMALKDKFNKNPNMYFPGTDNSSHGSNGRTENNSSRNSNKSSSRRSLVDSPTKTHTSLEDDLSDTDTLIHNMSDGSYEKDSSSISPDEHDSFGSAKGSRSSGNSSLSPHNSMEGSPRMQQQNVVAQFQPAPSNSSVLMGKKTIRNYTPKESSNMLREFEDKRNNSVDWRSKHKASKRVERKSSMERMIDDFHNSLPAVHPSSNDATMTTSATGGSKRQSNNGTMNSQISNWSAASSAASFDYQPGGSNHMKKTKSHRDLPSVDEDDDEQQPHGERIPPEGAPSVSKGVSPTNFVHRIEIKSTNGKTRRKSNEDLQPLPPPPPPPPVEPPIGKESEAVADDDFSKLHRLISEGRISGLNEKPPSFVPPSPPKQRVERSASASQQRRSGSPSKNPAPSTPKTPKSSHSAERQPSRKDRAAPQPPIVRNPESAVSTPSSDIKFVSSRHRESLEDLTKMTSKKRSEVKRSSSNHGTRPSGMLMTLN